MFLGSRQGSFSISASNKGSRESFNEYVPFGEFTIRFSLENLKIKVCLMEAVKIRTEDMELRNSHTFRLGISREYSRSGTYTEFA